MKYLLSFATLTALLTAAVAQADNSGPDKPTVARMVEQSDKDRLQGRWVDTNTERFGKETKSCGGGYTFSGNAMENNCIQGSSFTFVLNPERKSLTITIRGTQFDVWKERKVVMLYQLQGDTLRLCCNGYFISEQPEEFNSKEGRFILTLKREAKKPEETPPPTALHICTG